MIAIDTNVMVRYYVDDEHAQQKKARRLSNIDFENEPVFARALMEYRENNCDFADALLGMLNQHYGYDTASFDRKAGKPLGFTLL